MRAWLYRQMGRPWVYRITCSVMFIAGMTAVGIGLRALKATHDSALIIEVCAAALLFMFVTAWIMDRKGWS